MNSQNRAIQLPRHRPPPNAGRLELPLPSGRRDGLQAVVAVVAIATIPPTPSSLKRRAAEVTYTKRSSRMWRHSMTPKNGDNSHYYR